MLTASYKETDHSMHFISSTLHLITFHISHISSGLVSTLYFKDMLFFYFFIQDSNISKIVSFAKQRDKLYNTEWEGNCAWWVGKDLEGIRAHLRQNLSVCMNDWGKLHKALEKVTALWVKNGIQDLLNIK